MTLTYIDTGVLIAAARGEGEIAQRAMAVLDDPSRTFASSDFVKLEALPMPTFHRRQAEIDFLQEYFDQVEIWPLSNAEIIERGLREASDAGLAALDALHVAAACILAVDVLVTTEKRTRALHRAQSVRVQSI